MLQQASRQTTRHATSHALASHTIFVHSHKPPSRCYLQGRQLPADLHHTPQVQLAALAPASAEAAAAAARAGKKKSKKMVDLNGEVLKDQGNGMFQVRLENGVSIIAHLSGKIRQNRIRIIVGDTVTVELSPYDLTKGRITFRYKANDPRLDPNNQPDAPQ